MIPNGGLCRGLSQGNLCLALGADLLYRIVSGQVFDTAVVALVQPLFLKLQLSVGSLFDSILQIFFLLF